MFSVWLRSEGKNWRVARTFLRDVKSHRMYVMRPLLVYANTFFHRGWLRRKTLVGRVKDSRREFKFFSRYTRAHVFPAGEIPESVLKFLPTDFNGRQAFIICVGCAPTDNSINGSTYLYEAANLSACISVFVTTMRNGKYEQNCVGGICNASAT